MGTEDNNGLYEYYDPSEESISFLAWYSIHKSQLYKDNPYYHHFVYDIHDNVLNDLNPVLRKLMLKHYPVLKTEKRPLLLNYFDEIIDFVTDGLVWQLYRILDDENQGINFREKYPKFNQWFNFYCKPRKPKKIKESIREWQPDLTDAEWEAYKEKENKALLKFHLWNENRIVEFTEVVRKSLFAHFPRITDLSADGWVLYAVNVRDAYSNFQSLGEDMEMFIDYGFPEEYLELPNEDFDKKLQEVTEEKRKYSQELRKRRIAGEQI